ncbi:hypothetical protein AGOR_G00164370 [Albula goreensis]|uniref:Transcription factor E2F8 n=1 Tax=Albula goreensis TaxID=1534307 RepID=A0A8T3CW72_9TELE|nr:hypothetical protein AGOR_G00164370 [Albula goreensis]
MSSVFLDLQNLNHKPRKGSICDGSSELEKGDAFAEPYALTKTPGKQSLSHTVSTESTHKMGSLTTPTKGKDVPTCEPWTPTSNLKILLSAASPEIRNRAKELCVNNTENTRPSNCPQESAFGDESEKLQISRKEKSLGLLCHKFLARYPDYPNPDFSNNICLDDVAGELNVERRRIYDIMNVLESLHMVSRLAKNRYTWHGRANLPQTLAMLKKVGEDQKYNEQMQQIKQKSIEREFDFEGEEKENEDARSLADGENDWGQKEMFFVELPGVEFRAASVNSRKDKSLRVMSQKFVMLFLVSCPRVVSLEVAAKILIGEDQVIDLDKSKYKTKIRRLYDIANVLSSLELIKKVHVTEERGRKPAFKWTGPEDFPSINETSTSMATGARPLESKSSLGNCTKNLFPSSGVKRSFTRHPSLIKLAKSIQDDRRKINSAPTSPVKAFPSDSSDSGSYPSKMAQLAAICKIQLDEQSKESKRNISPAPENAPKTEEKAGESTGVAKSVLTAEANDKSTVHVPCTAQPVGALPCNPSQYSPLIPVLLPQHAIGRPYAVYMHPSAVKPHPSGLAVRSMTFEENGGGSQSDSMKEKPAEKNMAGCETQAINRLLQNPDPTRSPSSPASALKRTCTEVPDNSPSKTMKTQNISEGCSPHKSKPKMGEMLRARLKAQRGAAPSRPSPRALHLDPEFVNTPETAAAEKLDQSVEKFLEKEEVLSPSDREAGLTPLRAVPVQEIAVLPETLIPTGYLIPISQQSFIRLKDSQCPSGETTQASVPNHNVHHTPTAGSVPVGAQEFTPTRFTLQRAPSMSVSPMPSPSLAPGQRLHSPSPAIINFTLQNLGLIPAGSPGAAATSVSATHRQASPVPTSLGLQQGSVIFVKPMSPVPLQYPSPGQPLTLLSLQQPLMATPKGTKPIQQSFFHTPGSTLSPLATVVTTAGHTTCKTVYIPQRKLEISTEDTLRTAPTDPTDPMLLNDLYQ